MSGPSLLERRRNEQAELSLLGLVLILTVDRCFLSRIPSTVIISVPTIPAFRVAVDHGCFPTPKLDVLGKRPVDPESPGWFSSFQRM